MKLKIVSLLGQDQSLSEGQVSDNLWPSTGGVARIHRPEAAPILGEGHSALSDSAARLEGCAKRDERSF